MHAYMENYSVFSFFLCLHFQWELSLNGTNLSKFFLSRDGPFERVLSSKTANRKLVKLFPFAKLMEKQGGISLHLIYQADFEADIMLTVLTPNFTVLHLELL